jgi:nucleoside-diphosphate-sugar epimerase
MSKLHVVLGAGAIGRAVAEELIRRGKTVRIINRSSNMEEALAGVEIVASDLYDPVEVRKVTKGAAVVYQCAQPRYFEWPEKFPPLQQAIIDGLTGSGAKLVIAENLYMYGETGGKAITEDMPYTAHTRKGRVRAQMSSTALAAHQEGKLRVSIGRGSDYFGPWGTDTSMGALVFYPLLKGKAGQVGGSTKMPHTHTYIPDFGKALVILGECTEADGQAWHVPNDMPEITQGELVQMFAEAAGVEPKMQVVGKFMMTLVGLFIPEAKESVEMMYEFEKPFIVDSSKFESAFGIQATPMHEAIQETVAWFQSHPEKKH